ncbi:MAG: site-specific integrase, partial [Micropepsaceae bacterium]
MTVPRAVALAQTVYAADMARMSDGMECFAVSMGDSDGDESSERETVSLALDGSAEKFSEALARGIFDLAKPDADALLSAHGYKASPDSNEYAALCRLILKARVEALRDLGRRTEGLSAGNHAFASPTRAPAANPSSKALRGVFEEWATIAAPAKHVVQRTVEGYRSTFERFVAFLGHDDAGRVTDEDVIRFAESRLVEGRSAKTVNGSDLAALKSVFGWAAKSKRLPRVPGGGYSVATAPKPRERARGYTDSEAVDILRAASSFAPNSREGVRTTAAKRW